MARLIDAIGPPELLSVTIVRNKSLDDGTPRQEKGYRAIFEFRGPGSHPVFARPCFAADERVTQKRYQWSPLFKTEAEARNWLAPAHPQGVVIDKPNSPAAAGVRSSAGPPNPQEGP